MTEAISVLLGTFLGIPLVFALGFVCMVMILAALFGWLIIISSGLPWWTWIIWWLIVSIDITVLYCMDR